MKNKHTIIYLLAVSLGLALWAGCGTVTPAQVHAGAASFDGTNQNSGVLEFTADGSALITAHARDRYNALAAVYSKKFLPPLSPDEGLRPQPLIIPGPPTWAIDPQHLNYFKTMNRWKREGK